MLLHFLKTVECVNYMAYAYTFPQYCCRRELDCLYLYIIFLTTVEGENKMIYAYTDEDLNLSRINIFYQQFMHKSDNDCFMFWLFLFGSTILNH